MADLPRLIRETLSKSSWRERLLPLDSLSYGLAFRFGVGNPAAPELWPNILGKRVLVLSPHQDDETLGCGGLILAREADTAAEVVFMTAGRGREGLRTPQQQIELAQRRTTEANAACQRLGIPAPTTLGLSTAELMDIEATTQRLTTLIEARAPDTILAPFLTDGHKEHVATCRALARVDPQLLGARQLLLYEVHTQLPDRFVTDILCLDAAQHQRKVEALEVYVSQHLDRRVTREKYLLRGRKLPSSMRRPGLVSMERYCRLSADTLAELERRIDFDQLVPELKSVNYSPYSFKNYWANRRAFIRHELN